VRMDGTEDVGLYGLDETSTRLVRAFVWSRTTRSKSRVLWYALFPFSLINMAGYMQPNPGSLRLGRYLRFAVRTLGVTLTLTYVLWLIALLSDEPATFAGNAFVYIPFHWGGLAVVVGGFLIVLLRRMLSADEGLNDTSVASPSFWNGESSRAMCAIHLLAVLGLLALLLLWPPYEHGVHLLFWTAAIQIGLVILLGLPIWVLSRGGLHQPAFAAIATCGAAIVLAQAYLSSARLAWTWILTYLDGFNLLFPPLSRPRGEATWPRFVLPQWLRKEGTSNLSDVVATYILCGILVVLIGILARRLPGWWARRQADQRQVRADYALTSGGKLPTWAKRIARARARRQVVVELPERLLWLGPLALLWVVVSVFLYLNLLDLSRHRLVSQFVTLGSHSLAVGAVVAALAFLTKMVRDRAAIVFDVTGLWPRKYHPLAGRPYGGPVLEQLTDTVREVAMREPLVLIGHSQGSVLAYLALLRLSAKLRRSIALITVGSPLGSLYRTFFPHYFTQGAFSALGGGPGGVKQWLNLYRDTDPIGGPIFDATAERLQESAPKNYAEAAVYRPKIHSEYWSEPRVVAADVRRTDAAQSP